MDRYPTPTKEEAALMKEVTGPIGYIVLQWSNGDRNLDWIIKIISEDHDTKSIINTESLTQSVGRKIRLLHTCFNQYPSLVNFKKDGKALMDKVEATSKERNKLIHGTFDGLNLSNKSMDFEYLTRPKKELKYNIERFTHTLATLLDLEKRIRDLASDMAAFGLTLRPKRDMP